ncbi:MAG: BlaI/MecI/CopY family transcriptional regulator [Isosphaeraceae bacterium]
MAKRSVPAPSELEVARIVWELGSASVQQVLDALPAERSLDFKTVQTYLRRLAAKGYLRTRRDGRTLIYSPKVQPRRVIGQVVDDLMNRLFDGEVWPLLRHLIEDRGISENDVRQLRDLLDRLEQEEPKP